MISEELSEELSAKISQAASTTLLRIARSYYEQGLFHQATSPYLKIVSYYPQSEVAPAAVEGLITIATTMEKQHHRRMAMAVYERLERAARFQRWDGHAISLEGDIV
jgi:hypothetical protein